MKQLVKISCVLLSVACFGLLTACHTVKGFGEDLQAGGKSISKAASQDKK